MEKQEFPADRAILNHKYVALLYGLNQFFIDEGNNNLATQLLKLVEEVGEVAAAFVGHIGSNPRKGLYKNRTDVVDELADVVITALVGIVLAGEDPNIALARQAKKTTDRLNEYYSRQVAEAVS